MSEPRFLLDKDSQCYGCQCYVHIDDARGDYMDSEVDANGGVCDVFDICAAGSKNSYLIEE